MQELRSLQAVTWREHAGADCVAQAACMHRFVGRHAHSTASLRRDVSLAPDGADQRQTVVMQRTMGLHAHSTSLQELLWTVVDPDSVLRACRSWTTCRR